MLKYKNNPSRLKRVFGLYSMELMFIRDYIIIFLDTWSFVNDHRFLEGS